MLSALLALALSLTMLLLAVTKAKVRESSTNPIIAKLLGLAIKHIRHM